MDSSPEKFAAVEEDENWKDVEVEAKEDTEAEMHHHNVREKSSSTVDQLQV